MQKSIHLCASLLALSAFTLPAFAQYPERAITVVVPFLPGALVDNVARVLVNDLGESLGQTIVVENRGGAGGMVGAGAVARSEPDGYTLLITADATVTIAPSLQADPPYDPLTDLSAIALIGESYLGLAVAPNSSYTSYGDILTAAKERPGELTVGSAGIGTSHHMIIELIQQRTGVEFNHIPFQGAAPAVQGVIAGELDLTFATLPTITSFLSSGHLNMVGISRTERHPAYPDVPTLAETTPEIAPVVSLGVFGPKGLDPAITTRIAEAVAASLQSPDVVTALSNMGFDPATTTPEAYGARVAEEYAIWAEVAKSAGLAP